MRILVSYPVDTGKGDFEGRYYREISCDSSEMGDISTADMADGSICVQTDTGKVFFYNEKTEAFVEQFSFKG